MSTLKKSSATGIVQPLTICEIRCDEGLATVMGGLYGMTRNGGTKFHGGVDLFAEPGTPCTAIYNGVVEWAFKTKSDWGLAALCRVNLPEGPCWVLYAHLSKLYVKGGAKLGPNTPIGETGLSGNADSKYPHLHFEAWSSLKAGPKSKEPWRYRFDPLLLLGHVSYQNFVHDVMRYNRTA